MTKIVENTNSYAENARNDSFFSDSDSYAREWTPVNITDIWQYLGSLLYMKMHIERKRENYWTKNSKLRQIFSLRRWEQIHRYFTLRDRFTQPRQEKKSWVWSVEPIAIMIRQNCSTLWLPSSYLSIDETMIAYRGRSLHKVKLPNKSIKEGYKI